MDLLLLRRQCNTCTTLLQSPPHQYLLRHHFDASKIWCVDIGWVLLPLVWWILGFVGARRMMWWQFNMVVDFGCVFGLKVCAIDGICLTIDLGLFGLFNLLYLLMFHLGLSRLLMFDFG